MWAFTAHSASSHAINNQELNALLPDRVSCLDAKTVKEMSSPTHSCGGDMRSWPGSLVGKPCILNVKPMQKEGKLLHRALITEVLASDMDFVTILKDAFQSVTKS